MNCPEGHQSATPDYCDVCGSPMIEEAAPAGQPSAPPVTAESGAPAAEQSAASDAAATSDKPCPHCGAPNAVDALFCEACGYDHTTGAMPRATNPLALDDDAPSGDDAAAPDEAEQPVAAHPDSEQPQADQPQVDQPQADQPQTEQPEPTPPPAPSPASQSLAMAPSAQAYEPVVPLPGLWVAEIWIDPGWYAQQAASDPMPSPGPPVIRQLTSSPVLIGRPSTSRASAPDLDCGSDTGVSRRHAQLTCDGKRWWVEDLNSSNGTYLGSAVGPLPGSPIPPASRREFDLDDRIYLGSWTRIVVRPSTPEEIADLT